MKKNAGIWIDHKKAVIVNITDDGEETHSIVSGMEKHVRHSGGAPEDRAEHRFSNHLKQYYEKVMVSIHGADSVLLFGPGEAKGELKNLLTKESAGVRIIDTETDDKMTDHQITAKVREHFLESTAQVHQIPKL